MATSALARRVTSLSLMLWLIVGSILGSRAAVSFASPSATAGHLPSAAIAVVATDDSYELDEDTTLSVPAAGVLANDTAAEPLAAALAIDPSHGTVALAPDGSFAYTPAANYVGTDTFQYAASTGTQAAIDAWAFDDGLSPTAGANGHAGTLLNGPTFTATVPPSLASGTAMSFDGVDDGITVDGIALANQSFSVAFWAKRSSIGTYDIAIGQGTGNANTVLHIGFRNTNVFTCAFWNNDLDSPSAYTDTDWHHWACTYDAATNQRALYRDGSLVAADTAAADYQGSGTFWIGNRNNGDYFGGLVDEVRLYASALTQAEVQAAMAGIPLQFRASATVTLTVHAINDAPEAQDDSYTTTQGSPLIPKIDGNPLSTLYAGGNYHNGNMFDVTAGASDVTITSFDVSFMATGTREIAIYYKPGSYVGSEQIAANWTLLGTQTVSALGASSATPVSIGGLEIPAGATYGLYVTATGAGVNLSYTNGANTYSDGTITITTGTGAAYPFGTRFSPRTWNGTLHYAIEASVLDNDPDPEGDQVSAALSTFPSHGTVSLASNGTFIYTPTLAFAGQDSFTYAASDGVLTDTALVTVDITPNAGPCMVETTGDGQTDASSADASALQTAVSAASPGALIKVAGRCAGVQTIDGVSQTLAITQSVRIQGGYTTSWLDTPGPDATTMLDAEGGGRVLSMSAPSSATLDRLTLTGGHGGLGGGIRNTGTLTLTHSTVISNTGDSDGGGIRNEAQLTLIDSTISQNTSAGVGGAVDNTGSLYVVASTLTGNTANGGGGIRNQGSATITGSTIANNSAVLFGGGIANTSGTLTLRSSTIAQNTVTGSGPGGGGILLEAGALTVTNSIIWDNRASAAVSSITTMSSTPAVSYSLLEGGFAGTGNLGGDPLFEATGYQLRAGSPALNVGSNAALPADEYDLDGDNDTAEPLPYDLDGQARVVNESVDMGAYERQTSLSATLDQPVDLTLLEDAGAQTVNLTGIGNLAGSGATSITATSSEPALVSSPAVSYASPSASGSLSFTPLANANGLATITVSAQAGSGEARPRSFTVTVTPVNDAPSFIAGPNQLVYANAGSIIVVGWASGFSPGPANEASQTVREYNLVSNSAPGLFAVAPALNASGKLTYTPKPGVKGTATIGVVARDSGGTANGGVDTSTVHTFTITIGASVRTYLPLVLR